MNVSHYRFEFARCAAAMYRAGSTDKGHLMSAAAAKAADCPPLQFAQALAIYRTWLRSEQVIL